MRGARRRAAAAGGSFVCAAGLWWIASSADLSRRPALEPERARELWDDAQSARSEGRLDECIGDVRRLLASYPGEPRYIGFQAEVLEQSRRYLDAARSWELYMTVAPFPTDACPSLGPDYVKAGRDADALDAERRCLALDPSKPDLMIPYALALERADRDAEAESLLMDALKRNEKNSDFAVALSRLRLKKGDVEGAAKLIDAVLPGDPENTDLLLSAARVSQARGDLKTARDRLDAAIKLSPGYADLYRVLAQVLEQGGDAAGARKARADAKDADARSAR
ncbi:MAG: tetratricopeptide repeat protein [Elusimicrobiota bacterium]